MDTRPLASAYRETILRAGVAPAELAKAAFESELLAVAYRDRFLPCPVFLEPGESAKLGTDLLLLHRLLASLPDRLFGGDRRAYCRALGLSDRQTELVARAPNQPLPALGRSDLYRGADGFRLLELNITSALGGFENTLLNTMMLEHPLLRDFVRGQGLAYSDTPRAIVRSMLRELGGRASGRRPVVALTDWPASFTSYAPRMRVMADFMTDLDIDVLVCHVGEVVARNGKLEVHGRPVDVIYRFFLLEEIEQDEDLQLVEPIIAAAERGEVLIFARMDAEAYGNKGALAMLSAELDGPSLNKQEREMVGRFLPWTRYVRQQVTDPDGQAVSVMEYARAQREDLILKPIMLHGGSGIVAGWRADPSEWLVEVERAMNGPWVLQQRVRPEPETFPRTDADGYYDLYFNWGAFVAEPDVVGGTGYAGCLARGSTEPEVGIVSMSEGAVVACCFYG